MIFIMILLCLAAAGALSKADLGASRKPAIALKLKYGVKQIYLVNLFKQHFSHVQIEYL